MSAFRRALRIEAGEGGLAASMVSLCVLVMIGQTIGVSGVTGLFLDRIGTAALPRAYLVQGVGAFAVMLVLAAMLGRIDQRRAFLAMSGALAVVVIIERVALFGDAPWIYWVLWVTAAAGVIVQTVFLWGIAGRVTDTRQAKRLFPLFAAGGIVGSVAGGLLTAPLAAAMGTANLVTAWAVALVAAFALGRALLTRGTAPTRSAVTHRADTSVIGDLAAAWRSIRASPLLVWMTIGAVLFSVLFYSLFLPWAAAAASRYPNAEDLAAFIGLFSAATTAAAFLLSTFVTNRVFARLGIATAVLLLPVLYTGSSGVLLVTSTFVALVAVRAVTGVWLQGVASPGWEALTNVVPDSRRDQVRAFLNGGPSQAGTAIAGLIALAGAEAVSPQALTTIGLLTAVATVFVTWRIKRSYASALASALHAGRPVFATLPTLTVPFELEPDGQALATVIDASRDPSPTVRRFAIELLSELHDERADAVLACAAEDADPVVAATAAAIVLSHADDPRSTDRLDRLAHDRDPIVRAAALQGLRHGPPRIGVRVAEGAVEDPEPAVRAEAVRTLAALDPERALDPAVALLADPSARVRHAAADACALIGAAAVPRLVAALHDVEERDASIQALSSLDATAHRSEIDALATSWAADAARDRASAAAIPADGDAAELLRTALLDRGRRSASLALTARSLSRDDGGSMRDAIGALDPTDRGRTAMALETLETIDPSTVRPLLALWDASAHTAPGAAPTMEEIARDPDPFIAMCAELVRTGEGSAPPVTEPRPAMPAMERVLFLRHVRLFEALPAGDLLPIAEIAEDLTFADGDLLGAQGDVGDGLHIVVTGAVSVEEDGAAIAERGPREVVGEMSMITRRPRMASMRAVGDVRTIWISSRAFEGMLHDRPDIAIGVMRVLADRLAER